VNPGTNQIFEVLPVISGMGKATNVKFGRYIQRVHANKSRLKNWEKIERGRIQGLPNFFECTLLSQEWIKLRTSNLAGIFTASIRTKALKILGENGAWAYPGTAPFFEYPLLSQERVKLRTSNLAGIFTGSMRTKAL